MVKQSKVITALKSQFDVDVKAIKGIHQEQAKLRAQYLRYMELEKQAVERVERIRRLVVILWRHDEVGTAGTATFSRARELGIALPDGWENISVWEAVLEILRQFPNTQMVDLLEWLENDLDMAVSRQSVDSALAAHRNLFKSKRSGKGKFVSLTEEGMSI